MRIAPRSLGAALLSVASATCCWSGRAMASPAADFATLDRASPDTQLEVSLGSVLIDEGPTWVGRLDLHAQFVTHADLGGYASLPLSFVIDDDSFAALGNLELGGFYVTGGRVPVVLRAGVTFDTAEDGRDAVANALAFFARSTDRASVAPGHTWLRLAASPTYSSGSFYLRGDVGIDVPFGGDDAFDDDDPLLRLNLGVGWRFGHAVAASLELVNLGTTGDVPPGEDRFLQSLALSVQGAGRGLEPFAALALPLDKALPGVQGALLLGLRNYLD